MTTAIQFTKMSGAGNDFVIVDDRAGVLHIDEPALAQSLCSRHRGVGADGLLLIRQCKRSMFMMEYYNADGSYGGMCGNGGRCIARYAFLKGFAPASMKFEALDHNYAARIEGTHVHLTMKNAAGLRRQESVRVGDSIFEGVFIDTGSPHFVTFVDNVDTVNVIESGKLLRFHPAFGKEGANIDFVQSVTPDSILMRTYERGVEDETLACGTGAVASALVSVLHAIGLERVAVTVRSGERLSVSFKRTEEGFSDVVLSGSAHVLFTGKLLFDGTSCSVSL